MDQFFSVAVIGAGGRACDVVGNLLRDSQHHVKVVAVYDPDKNEAKHSIEKWNEAANVTIYDSYQEAIHAPGVDWVMVFSPNAYHCEHILAAFAAGKHVFTEKPLATSVEDCQKIYAAHAAHPELKFATGFVLRYSKLYLKAKELLDSGAFGKLLHIQGNENIAPAHGGYIMCNWRRHTSEAGPHILEKCCHDLDLINWYCQSQVSKVSGFGARRFFIPKNAYLMEKYGKETFMSWRDPHGVENPFTSDTDLIDTQTLIAQYRNGITVDFTATMSNAKPERRLLFSCSEGTLSVELYSMTLNYSLLKEQVDHTLKYTGDGHAGGDSFIMKELYEAMSTDAQPKCSGNEGLESAVFALGADQAMKTMQVVDMEKVWKSLGR